LRIDSDTRTRVFLAFIFMAVMFLAIAGIQANKQNQVFLQDYQQTEQAEELLRQAKFSEAAPMYYSLIKKHDYYSVFYWRYGLCLAGQQKWAEAFQQLDKARQIRPALMTDQVFLVQYGEMLYHTDQYTRSKQYLKQSLTYGTDSQAGKIAAKLLPMVEQKLSRAKGGYPLEQKEVKD